MSTRRRKRDFKLTVLAQEQMDINSLEKYYVENFSTASKE